MVREKRRLRTEAAVVTASLTNTLTHTHQQLVGRERGSVSAICVTFAEDQLLRQLLSFNRPVSGGEKWGHRSSPRDVTCSPQPVS